MAFQLLSGRLYCCKAPARSAPLRRYGQVITDRPITVRPSLSESTVGNKTAQSLKLTHIDKEDAIDRVHSIKLRIDVENSFGNGNLRHLATDGDISSMDHKVKVDFGSLKRSSGYTQAEVIRTLQSEVHGREEGFKFKVGGLLSFFDGRQKSSSFPVSPKCLLVAKARHSPIMKSGNLLLNHREKLSSHLPQRSYHVSAASFFGRTSLALLGGEKPDHYDEILKAKNDVIKSKDDVIKALDATVKAKDELIARDGEYIAFMRYAIEDLNKSYTRLVQVLVSREIIYWTETEQIWAKEIAKSKDHTALWTAYLTADPDGILKMLKEIPEYQNVTAEQAGEEVNRYFVHLSTMIHWVCPKHDSVDLYSMLCPVKGVEILKLCAKTWKDEILGVKSKVPKPKPKN